MNTSRNLNESHNKLCRAFLCVCVCVCVYKKVYSYDNLLGCRARVDALMMEAAGSSETSDCLCEAA
jgi:hypothetical protein